MTLMVILLIGEGAYLVGSVAVLSVKFLHELGRDMRETN